MQDERPVRQRAEREDLLAASHSPTVRKILRAVERICEPQGTAWRKPLRRHIAKVLFGPLRVNEPWPRERINALLGEVQRLGAQVNPRPKRRNRVVRDSTLNAGRNHPAS